jgi:3-oxoacyl-[acyl-carrier protein] reductase
MDANNVEVRKCALVTGAAGGIGAACARALGAAGMNVVVNYHSDGSAERAQALCDEITAAHGVDALALQANVADFDEAKEMISQVKSAFGRVDVLVNNAGITRDGLIMRMSAEQFQSVIDTNLGGTFNCTRHVIPLMSKQRAGRVINISSVVGVYGNAGQTNYSASKAGVIGFTKSLAKEMGARGITANAVAPGYIETAMTAALDEAAHENLTKNIALRRLGNPEDVAGVVAFLASDAASYITGQVIEVDGGMAI